MTDPNEIIDAYQRYTRALAQANRMNKDTLFDALAQTAITVVSVEFDGEGDEGQIGEMTAHAGDGAVPLPELPVTLHHANNSTVRLDSRQTTLREAIETLCYGYLEQQHSGWENNDGAYGEYTFDVAERTITLDYNERHMESDYSQHVF